MKQSYAQMKPYIGDINQLMPVLDGKLSGGFQDGVRFVEVSNGGNLVVTVLPDRCMDIYQVRYKGKNINYIGPCGITAPSYYDSQGDGWLRSFYAGMLTTIGLQNVGAAATVGGVAQGLHGRISNAPAELVNCNRTLVNDLPAVTLEGSMREAQFFGENLQLTRKYEFCYEEDAILLTDTITNHGYGPRPFVYGLHLNYGYPLLDEGVELTIPTENITPRSQHAADHIDTWQQVDAPAYPFEERCYLHDMKKDENGLCYYEIYNPKLNMGVRVQYNGNQFPYFCQWKMLEKGHYIMGLEPYNAPLDGPKLFEEGCKAPVLAPGESIVHKVKLEFFSK